MSDYDEPEVTCLRETERAILVSRLGVETWIPKSVISDESEVFEEGGTGTLLVKSWWAEKEGWL